MGKAFTAYWSAEAWNGNSYRPVEHAASNEFSKRGVRPGDRLYIVHYQAREVYLGAKLDVDAMVSKSEAADALRVREDEIWDATDHVLADPAKVQWLDPDRVVPLSILQALTFMRPDGSESSLAFDADGAANQQTLRTVRRLAAVAAAHLDALIGHGDPCARDVLSVTLRRGPCNGDCPVYAVEYWRDGLATWQGLSFVERVGRFVGRINEDHFRALIDHALDRNFFQWQQADDPMFDVADHEIVVRTGAQEKSVTRWALGDPEFNDLAERLDELAREIDWAVLDDSG